MSYNIKLFILMILASNVNAQLSEDFSSGNLRQWEGDTSSYTINQDLVLQLNDIKAGSSEIYHKLPFTDSLSWEFDLELKFSPSQNNNIRIVLAAQNVDVNKGSAFVLDIGETGSQDRIHFKHLNEGVENLIASGNSHFLSTSFKIKMKLQLVEADIWYLDIFDYKSNAWYNEFETHFQIGSPEYYNYFGFICSYTSSNKDKFYFDNIEIQKITPDTEAPFLLEVIALDSSSIMACFNEDIDASVISQKELYKLNPSKRIKEILFVENDKSKILITLDDKLSACESYELNVSNIPDTTGNILTEQTAAFGFFESVTPGDIIITEILFNPVDGSNDFIELQNVSSKNINLKGLLIRNNARDEELKIENDIILNTNEIVCLSPDLAIFKKTYTLEFYNNIIEQALPSFNNRDGNVSLIKAYDGENRITIDSFDYSEDMHLNNLSSKEGYSLERKMLLTKVNNTDNWSSSLDSINNSTPGLSNSIFIQGFFYQTEIINTQEIEINFLGNIDPNYLLNIDNYHINGIEITDIYFNRERPKYVSIFLRDELTDGHEYLLEISEMLDECGWNIAAAMIPIRILNQAESGDLLINEILFNPVKDNFDYVEIINVSNKFIYTAGIEIINRQNNQSETIVSNLIMEPGQIVAYTENTEILKAHYQPPDTARIYYQRLPAFNNDQGNVSLSVGSSGTELFLDSFNYSDSLHFILLESTDGVSLERISTNLESNNSENWFSSSESNKYGTPGFKNSAAAEEKNYQENVFLSYKVFSPDGDGYKDLLFLNYNLERSGFIANVDLYNDAGVFIKHIAQSQLLAREGFIGWDGTNSIDRLAPVGMYIVYYELLHPEGIVIRGKEVCVLAQKLN